MSGEVGRPSRPGPPHQLLLLQLCMACEAGAARRVLLVGGRVAVVEAGGKKNDQVWIGAGARRARPCQVGRRVGPGFSTCHVDRG